MSECQGGSIKTDLIDPIALRTAKTPLSFGHSECNRVKRDLIKVAVK